ncbi:MAG: TRAP transporter TatT component family protein [Vicinamibacteria bacterium]|nr:TRAP transporter TatT component family protein [Vicinamibacteria bacterium]
MRHKPIQRRTQNAALLAVVLFPVVTCSCSIRKLAVNSLGDALAGGGSIYARDDDPDLVGDAVPFGLKTMEALIETSPRHQKLLLAAASGFVQYAYAWVQQEADFIEEQDLSRATAMRSRAVRLYLRGRDYGFRGLEVDVAGFRSKLGTEPGESLRRMNLKRKHVPLLYWTGMAWFGAIALDKSNAELSADQHVAQALIAEALRLDENFEHGAIHDFFISWEARGASVGGSIERAREHFQRATEISQGRRALPFVNLAESVAVSLQNRQEFEALLEKALDVDLDQLPDIRLNNVIAQKRALWLLGRADELFVE